MLLTINIIIDIFWIHETDILLLKFINILCMCAMSVSEVTKLVVSVLAFQ